eukprot:TRINITY_DN8220_c0_g1_i3.p1 TRINITY_DN8220_c0_g1~~TRINITY_DN8220_c0_g1_i3.p1  ORF type:complete len:436 (+),score=71.49 TRINITY_DN8220_c0_g1_i3:157-1464(+)
MQMDRIESAFTMKLRNQNLRNTIMVLSSTVITIAAAAVLFYFQDRRDKGKGEKTQMEQIRQQFHETSTFKKSRLCFKDVIGLKNAKQALREAVILPLEYPHLFKGKRRPWKGILLYGPPGNGKSMLAEAIAGEISDCTLFTISASDLVSKFYGDSEKMIRGLFESARDNAPAIIFIDEIDSIATNRGDDPRPFERRIKTELLIQMDGVNADSNKRVLVLASTNTPWSLDSAFIRRAEKRICVGLPDIEARVDLLKYHLGQNNHTISDEEFEALAAQTEGFSGADISILCREALLEPLRRLQTATAFRWIPDASQTTENRTLNDPTETTQPTNTNYAKYKKIAEKLRGVVKITKNVPPVHEVVQDMKANMKLVVCAPNDADALHMTLHEIPTEHRSKVLPPLTCSRDFEKALLNIKPSVAASDLARFEAWTKEFGV